MEEKHCPYYKYGQCTAAPKDIATVVVSKERCLSDWKSCSFYNNRSRKESLNNSLTREVTNLNNGSLEEYMKNVETSITTSCPLLVNFKCLARGTILSPSEVKLCNTLWRECPDRKRYMKSKEKVSDDLALIVKSIIDDSE